MADFNTLREHLRLDRQQLAQAENELLVARELAKQADARLFELQRFIDSNAPENLAELTAAQTEVRASKSLLEKRRATVQLLRDRLQATSSAFQAFNDPTTQIQQLNSRFPLLLFPVRLETRFKKVPDKVDPEAPPKDQLWVRVYPDDCLINTFEETLSESEIRSSERFWQSMWQSGRDVEQERAAWRGLCATHGSGRAEWIQQSYRPLNELERPTRNLPGEIILVVSAQDAPSQPVFDAAKKLWTAIWKANRNLEKENEAKTALIEQYGASVVQQVIEQYRPFNLNIEPPKGQSRQLSPVTVAFLILPSPPSKELGWNRPPRVELLPDRFVLMSYFGGAEELMVVGKPIQSPLVVGIDPAAPREKQMHSDKNGNLVVPDEMQWMVDFEKAIQCGMGFQIDLTSEQASRGFDRMLVFGLRMETVPEEGHKLVEKLFIEHHYGLAGIAIVPQGTPTNNMEGRTSGHTRVDDSDTSFDRLFGSSNRPSLSTDPFEKSDGQWLSEMLGLDSSALQTIGNYSGFDQAEAKAMNRLLSPATVRYFMRTSLHPLFNGDDSLIDSTSKFFELFVSGRGAIPTIRIGSQPYGILPISSLPDMDWFRSFPGKKLAGYLGKLHPVLMHADGIWSELAGQVSALGRPKSDHHQLLLDILGLQPASAEFHMRFALSRAYLFNLLALPEASLFFNVSQEAVDQATRYLQENFGVVGTTPAQTELHYFLSPFAMHGPLIDDNPLSEFDQIQYDGDVPNYLAWMAEIRYRDLDELRLERSFYGSSPTALLYLIARHSLMLGYHDAAYRLYRKALLPIDEFLQEPDFVHMPRERQSNSRWRPLYQTAEKLTGNFLMWEYIQKLLATSSVPQARPLIDQFACLKRLASLPTARLERLLVEHLDCVSYRYDAWVLGLCHAQLAMMRYENLDSNLKPVNPGVYVGAFAWLENVRSEKKVLEKVELTPDLAAIFNSDKDVEPVTKDSTNGGYIHAPSLNHATTAAVLRNGYVSNRTSDSDVALAVNLSSNRVRLALSFLEGLRNGQSLGALLGYQLERGLHDAYDLAACDATIYDLRDAFPLRSHNLQSTKVTEADKAAAAAVSPKTKPIESIEARNVIDGLKLIEQTRVGGEAYPFGLPPDRLPELRSDNLDEAAIMAAVNAEVQRLLDVHDAIGDLALAEGVHQATQGNYDRVSAALTSMTTGNCPPVPAVVQTPTKGIVLTHRVGLHLDVDVVAPLSAPPRQIAEPSLNAWVADGLPSMNRVACMVRWFNIETDANGQELETIVDSQTVLMSELYLTALDWIAIVPLEARGQLDELDDRVMRHIFASGDPHPGVAWRIEYDSPPTGMIRIGLAKAALPADRLSVSEIATLTRTLRTLIQKSRPLQAVDISRAEQPDAQVPSPRESDFLRVQAVRDRLQTVEVQLQGAQVGLGQLLISPSENFDEIIRSVDGKLTETVSILEQAARFGIPQSGWGVFYKARRAFYVSSRHLVEARIQEWQPRGQAYQAKLAEYQVLPVDAEEELRRTILGDAIALLVSSPAQLPTTLRELEQFVIRSGDEFLAKLTAMQTLVAKPAASLLLARTAIQQFLPLLPFDTKPFDIASLDKSVTGLLDQMRSALLLVLRETELRLATANSKLASYQNSTDGAARTRILMEAARALLGDEFSFIPQFDLPEELGNEWSNAVLAANKESLLGYLTGTLEIDFPVDQWLYGIARVRPQMANWERMIMHGDAFRDSAVVAEGDIARPQPCELTATQFPFQPGEPWLALEYPANYRSKGEHLLYTASYAQPFDKLKPCAGLLVDQWTEVIPAPDAPDFSESNEEPAKTTHETGLAFHYDRPNNEAPQTLLLVLPSNWKENPEWQWRDLVGALNSALDLAKKRAVEPDALSQTTLAQFLPAINMAKTNEDISIGTLLARNNGVKS